MKHERRISRRALVRRFMTSCTVVGAVSLVIGIIIGVIIGTHMSVTAEAASLTADGPGADGHIELNMIEPISEDNVTVIETAEETVSAPETASAEIVSETGTAKLEIITLSEEEEEILLQIAMAEAEDQGIAGKALIMNTVLNRVESASFPDSVEEVVFQRKQFSPVADGRYYKVTPDEECYEALELVEAGWDESKGATYFCKSGSSRWHENHLTRLFQRGSHTFYK